MRFDLALFCDVVFASLAMFVIFVACHFSLWLIGKWIEDYRLQREPSVFNLVTPISLILVSIIATASLAYYFSI